ncbi:MAG: TraE/TraK family type IV conjugative transfer system protein, partial [Elusimicrobiales bacterium]|nr:TraE/TraK family type IV conjugative transfer system protein [Elusimicrobiales bacterium]
MRIGPDLLNIAIYLPLTAAVLIALLPRAREHFSGPLALAASLLAFIPALALYLGFDPALPGMQFAQDLPWLSALGARYAVGLALNVTPATASANFEELLTLYSPRAYGSGRKTFYAMAR